MNTYDQRKTRNLTVYYKMFHGIAPSYLTDILPKKGSQRTNYNIRNRNDIQAIPARTTTYQRSFIPDTTKKWNDLPDEIRYIGGLHDFKNHLKKHEHPSQSHYYRGSRMYQTISARMRMKCSALNSHLHEMHIIDSPTCSCGHNKEDEEHYFFTCQNYTNIRHTFNNLDNQTVLSLKTFLHGDRGISRRQNNLLIDTVTDYIKQTKRF